MKQTFGILIIFLFSVLSFAQANSNEAADRIPIKVLNPIGIENKNTANILQNNIMKIVTLNGLSATDSRFVILPKVTYLSKSNSPSAPSKILVELDVSLFLGDLYTGTLMTSSSFTVKGVGANETQAYLNAIKSINIRDRKVKMMIVHGKTKILEYFNAESEQIFNRIKGLIASKDYSSAIIEVAAIPSACENLRDKASELLAQIPVAEKEKTELTTAAINNYYYNESTQERAEILAQ